MEYLDVNEESDSEIALYEKDIRLYVCLIVCCCLNMMCS